MCVPPLASAAWEPRLGFPILPRASCDAGHRRGRGPGSAFHNQVYAQGPALFTRQRARSEVENEGVKLLIYL